MAIKAIINNTEKEIEQIKNSDEQDIDYVYSRIGDTEVEGESSISIKSIGGELADYRIYGQTVDGESVGDLITEGEHAGEYSVPVTVTNGTDTVTTNLYLPEQIKMVGDEAEYVDYGQQKMHRVRKNLLLNTATNRTINGVTFTVNEDGSITCNGTATNTAEIRLFSSFSLPAGSYRLTGAPSSGSVSSYYLRAWYSSGTTTVWLIDGGSGYDFTLTDTTTMNSSIVIRPNQVLNHITFYPMIHKADIEDNTYEPYITNTELDVTLPALSTIKGTNILSVNTTIQPSNIYIKDNFDYKRIFTATRAIEDELPLSYRSIEDNDSTLSNYRIYGDTVGGAGVGDLVESGEHAGEYKVAVTVEGKNLCNNIWEQKAINVETGNTSPNENTVCCDFIPVKPNVTYSCSRTIANNYNNLRCYGTNKNYLGTGADLANKGNPLKQGELFGTFMITDARVSYIRFNDLSNSLDTKYMLVEGRYTAETMPPYEPYHAPVTTNLYLPEQIKMVGDEAEYVDYGQQKQHRVRKNLWSGVVEQGGVSERGDYVSNTKRIRSKNVPLEPGTYAISTNLLLLVIYAFNDTQKIGLCASIYQGSYSYTITVPAGANNISIGMMKVVDGVQVDITPSDFEWGQVEKGSEVTNYEPYIENTEVDVTLPALPTLSGTNTLSVGTEVQPSRVYLKGKIKEIN